MNKRSALLFIAGFLLISAALLPASRADECGSCCGSFCDESICVLKCEYLYKNNPVIRGCTFWTELTGACHNCQYGDMDIKACQDYPNEKACKDNPCGLGAGCEWNGGYCSRKLVPAEDCRFTGCNQGYKCIPNGECTTLSIEEYCNGHNYPYASALLSKSCDDPIFPPLEQALCRECQSDYELKKTSGDIRGMIYGVAAGLAVLLMMVNGLKLLTSEDASARSGAKKGIAYILIGLCVIVAATSFIEDVYKTPPVTPSSVSKSNQKPIAQALVGLAPLPGLKYLNTEKRINVYFDASSSKDLDGSITEYRWEFGDGQTASGAAVEHAYADEGVYTVKLTVLDEEGEEGTDIAMVTTKGFEAVIFSPENGAIIYQVGRITEFRGAARYGTACTPPEDYKYNWSWDGMFMSDKPTFTRNTLDLPLGQHTLTLSAKDCGGRDASNVTTVYVVKPLIAKILIPEKDGDSISETCVDNTIKFTGTAYGGRPPYRYKWKAKNIVFAEGTIPDEGIERTVTVNLGADGLPRGTYDIVLEINDSLGLIDQDTRQQINVDCDLCSEYKSTGKLPPKYDLRKVNGKSYMTPVKDQDDCGSCWVFAALGAVESDYKVQKKDPTMSPDLSEQDLVSCAPLGGCLGGFAPEALSYMQTKGVCNDIYFPYQDIGTGMDTKTNVPCTRQMLPGCSGKWRITGYSSVSSEPEIKAALICHGALATGTLLWGHAFIFAGYDDDNAVCKAKYRTPGCWIIKNSWGRLNGWVQPGDLWHENGYAYIPYNHPFAQNAISVRGLQYAEGIQPSL